jgi:hypothetical protein
VEARYFIIFTDQKTLVYAFKQNRDKCSPQQFIYLEYISHFTTDIRHISGRGNVLADVLFRVEAITVPVTSETVAASQKEDKELHTLPEMDTALPLEKMYVTGTIVTL